MPVINALSDRYHPCQALADVLTLKEHFGRLDGLKLAFVGDGNNVAHSLMLTAGRLGMQVAVATPAGYEPNAEITAAGAPIWARSPSPNDPQKPSPARTPCIPMCGPAWDRKRKPTRAAAAFRPIR